MPAHLRLKSLSREALAEFLAENLTLLESQRLTSISPGDLGEYRFANILGTIVDDFAASGHW